MPPHPLNRPDHPETEAMASLAMTKDVEIQPYGLRGDLALPQPDMGLVLFAHGSGSGRLSPRNRHVAEGLQSAGLGTLLFDLLTEDESTDRYKVFDVPLLAGRLAAATEFIRSRSDAGDTRIGYFGASTGAAAALVASTIVPDPIRAIVSRGGRPDLAGNRLVEVTAPTLLIVGGLDEGVIALNERAHARLEADKQIAIVPGAGHLFEEPGTLDQVILLARDWFVRHLGSAP